MSKGLDELISVCYRLATEAGWYEGKDQKDPTFIASRLCLIHSEISEALEGVRKNKQDDHLPQFKSVEVELADAVIRIADLCGSLKLDLAGALISKLAYNLTRADHQRAARAAEGGKKF